MRKLLFTLLSLMSLFSYSQEFNKDPIEYFGREKTLTSKKWNAVIIYPVYSIDKDGMYSYISARSVKGRIIANTMVLETFDGEKVSIHSSMDKIHHKGDDLYKINDNDINTFKQGVSRIILQNGEDVVFERKFSFDQVGYYLYDFLNRGKNEHENNIKHEEKNLVEKEDIRMTLNVPGYHLSKSAFLDYCSLSCLAVGAGIAIYGSQIKDNVTNNKYGEINIESKKSQRNAAYVIGGVFGIAGLVCEIFAIKHKLNAGRSLQIYSSQNEVGMRFNY